jgi:competence protein ComEC
VTIFYYCIVLFADFVYFRRPALKKVICTVLILAMIIYLGALKWQRTHRDNLILTCLDVGHGQSILAQLPGKANVLFDAGALHKDNIGQRVIIPFLDHIGIDKIDAIVISHNDIDHINGMPEIVDSCKVGTVYANDAFFSKTDLWGTAKFLKESLQAKGLEIQPLEKDLKLHSAATIKILWPGKQISQDQTLGDNDKSTVALIEFAGTKILLCSDIERFAQRELLRLFPDLKADIVVIPHHGSVKSLDTDFIKNLASDILICSCSQTQYEKYQKTERALKTKSFYTAMHGAITIRINKNSTVTTDVFVNSR